MWFAVMLLVSRLLGESQVGSIVLPRSSQWCLGSCSCGLSFTGIQSCLLLSWFPESLPFSASLLSGLLAYSPRSEFPGTDESRSLERSQARVLEGDGG